MTTRRVPSMTATVMSHLLSKVAPRATAGLVALLASMAGPAPTGWAGCPVFIVTLPSAELCRHDESQERGAHCLPHGWVLCQEPQSRAAVEERFRLGVGKGNWRVNGNSPGGEAGKGRENSAEG